MSAALRRFKWVVGLGAFMGIVVAAWMVYELPSFTPREAPQYSAAARLFVTSAEGQYVRLSVPRTVETPNAGGEGATGSVVVNQAPNVEPLLAAANLYPLIIESDEVAQLRQKKYGNLAGEVFASAYTSVSTPTRFLPAQLPIIDVVATSGSARNSIALAQATAATFKVWIQRSQNRAGVAQRDRIVINQLRAPREAVVSGGPSWGLPILAAIAVASAFAILAIVLDQLIPVSRSTTDPEGSSDAASGTPAPSQPASTTRWA